MMGTPRATPLYPRPVRVPPINLWTWPQAFALALWIGFSPLRDFRR
jgi:hypothetical protein